MNLWIALVACDRGDPSGKGDCVGCDALPDPSRVARLTHVQWENTVQDLLHLPAPSGLSAGFIGDRLAEGFENDAEGLQVGPELWVDYQRAAETLATDLLADPARYGVVVPEDDGGGGPETTLTVEGEDPSVVTTTGGNAGDAWNLWSAGELTATFDVPAAGTWAVAARVWADQAGADLARATMSVDGAQLVDADVAAASEAEAEELTTSVTLSPGIHTVTVSFENDYYEAGRDRNLYVDHITLTGGGGGPAPGDASRDTWIADFGARAHRRPLTSAERDEYGALFDAAADLGPSGDPFRDGVQLVVTAMLQSPHFVYRVDESTTPDASGRIPLSDWEIASKLSYGLWNTMPDDELFAAAADGSLKDVDGLKVQAERLLAHPRARATMADLHRQLLHVDNYVNIAKDDGLYPEFNPTTPASMQAEVYAYVDDVVFSGGSVHELYTRPSTFVNADLAPIYGLDPVDGDALVRRDLDPTQRAGLLTLSGFLALEADAYVHSTIRRGVFLNLAVLCTDLPPPPDNVPPLPASDGQLTTRERVDLHTGPGTCGAACHGTLINPLGFPYENYDALGRWQTEEFGQPIDAASSFEFTDGDRGFSGAVELAQVLGSSPDAHRCYAKHLLEYVGARASEPADDALITAIAKSSAAGDTPILDLVVELVTSDGFRFRPPAAGPLGGE